MVTVSKKSPPTSALCWKPPMTAGLLVAHGVCIAIAAIMVQAARKFQTKESALAFYGVYHREPVNQAIHFLGVPGIIFSLFVFQFHVGPLLPAPAPVLDLPFVPAHTVNWAALYALFYVVFYYSIDPVGAALYLPVLYAMYAGAARWTCHDRVQASSSPLPKSWTGTGRALRGALYVHAFCWYTQIHWGHKIAEGSTPALAQSLGGALTTAPLFAFYEAAWAVGLRPTLQRQVHELVHQYTLDLCRNGAVMRICEQALAAAAEVESSVSASA